MPTVKLRYETERFESLMRRFKRSVDRENILKDYAKHEFFEKPSLIKKRKKSLARKRAKYASQPRALQRQTRQKY